MYTNEIIRGDVFSRVVLPARFVGGYWRQLQSYIRNPIGTTFR